MMALRLVQTRHKRKQSRQDRQERLLKGCCPIHGISMPQTGIDKIDGVDVSVVSCPRQDCDVEATTVNLDGPAFLRPWQADLIR